MSQSKQPRYRLRLPWQRGSTGHVCSIYPGAVHDQLSAEGVLIGIDMLSADAWLWDPFEFYAQGYVPNPNVAIFGQPGQRKSTLVKTFLARMFSLYGSRRWVGIADPKGEYVTLAERLGLAVIRLSPGGTTRINPLAPGPAAGHEDPAKTAIRRADTVRDLLGAVLRRDLSAGEEAILYGAVDIVMRGRAGEPTLADLAGVLADPPQEMAERLRRDVGTVAGSARDLYDGLDSLIEHALRGMFDGPGVSLDDQTPGVVLDLSGLDIGSRAMPLVLMAATGWLSEFLVVPGPQRIQVIDELWVGAGDRHFSRHLQRCQKLGRNFGVANMQIAHKVTDAAAQADDGSAESKIAGGLLADTATKIILRQDAEQLDIAQHAFGLTGTERDWIGSLVPGRALWLLDGHRAVVQHHLASAERELVDTDQRMGIYAKS